ncbi:MAG: zinc-dependent peptidase [Spirochaetales bacterium]|nr:zinc-dependent peptidase [Spirochaetales bacterium]
MGISLLPIIRLYKSNFMYIMAASVGCCILMLLLYLFFIRKYRKRKKIIKNPFPAEMEHILNTQVSYYSLLNDDEKQRFKQEVQIFLGEKRLTGIETEVDDKCRVLVAASAIIPTFSYPDWEYDELGEILIYPHDFDKDYDLSASGANILGLVTRGGSTMVLSKTSLYHGFSIDSDKTNVGFHEFAHKVDGEDGYIDGVPPLITDRNVLRQWLNIIKKESHEIEEGRSDINPYALTSRAEFFAVVSEYFFENPAVMAKEHPELYGILQKIFKQDTKSMFQSVVKSMFKPYGKKIGRNAPCPCGSGKKYKKCCLGKKRQ